MEIEPIAIAYNGFSDKFGIPRQSREDSVLETYIVFESGYRHREALRGIEQFSHLWLIWGFHQTTGSSPTVRPPRLGGNTRVGVFATRSPFRPNHLGLSSVRLLRIEESATNGLILVVRGADMLDGTPIYDIKPYLAYTDSHPEANSGFATLAQDYRLPVKGMALLAEKAGKEFPADAIEEILGQDPRPAYQHDPNRVYAIEYGGWTVHFRVTDNVIIALQATRL